MYRGMYTYIKLSIKGKKFKKLEIINCPQIYTVLVIVPDRGKYFAERASICDGHFWCALGQNSWFLVGKLQNFDNFMENN